MRRREAGFSVMEMVVIAAVVVIIGAIAVPNLVTSSRTYKLSNAANALAQQFNLARQEAVRTNLPTKVFVDGLTVKIDLNHNGNFADDGGVATLATDTGVAIANPTVARTTASGGDGPFYVVFSSRGDLRLGDTPPVFRITYQGKTRDVTIDTRGATAVTAQY